MEAPPFDPAAHRVVPQRDFEDLKVGEKFALPSAKDPSALRRRDLGVSDSDPETSSRESAR
jgi:hypothetical protein